MEKFSILYKDGTHSIDEMENKADVLFEKMQSDEKIDCIITEDQFDILYKIYDGDKWVYHWDNPTLYQELFNKKQLGV